MNIVYLALYACLRVLSDNNIYGSEIRTLLASIESSDERENYILMDRIRPPTQHGVILRKSSDEPFVYDNLFTEVGICGVYVRYEPEGVYVRYEPEEVAVSYRILPIYFLVSRDF